MTLIETDPEPKRTERPARSLRMTLAYDGTNYCGWQVQPNGTALQAVVEEGLFQFTGEKIRVVASGRTDAGVHALGQVISFTTQSTAPCRGFLQGLPVHLPEDVVVRAVEDAPAGFNARYDAQRKWYRYIIHNSPVRNPFLRHYTVWQRARLDDQAMDAAVRQLVGTHDFRCFETQWPNRSSSVRTIFHASVTRGAAWEIWGAPPIADANEFLCFDIEADGFLYNMVRAIAGTLIHVGRGRWSSADMLRILTEGKRTQAGETAPPQGLYLMQVGYSDAPLAAQSARTDQR